MKENNLIFNFFVLTSVLFSNSVCAQTVTIGSQVWSSTNLNVSTYRNGDIIPQVQDEEAWAQLTTGAWCYYRNDPANGTKFGKLYNWYAVNDARGLAPQGYYIPSDAEWDILLDYLGGADSAGTKIKSPSGWYRNGNGTNSSGFSALPCGYRYGVGAFAPLGDANWWSSSEGSPDDAWARSVDFSSGSVTRGGDDKKFGFSVRCLFRVSSSSNTSTEKVECIAESRESGGLVTIGSQVWSSTNLSVSTYRNGDIIPQVQDEEAWAELTTGAWCYYQNDPANGTKYAKLYNWYAVNDERGLAPQGYHIPSDAEWEILLDHLGGASAAGAKMKSTSCWHRNGNGTNSSGFFGLPGGCRSEDGLFRFVGDFGNWWSSSEDSKSTAWLRFLSCVDGDVVRPNFDKRGGFSVRCIKD
jgi:uncharacterized protein (TIGR02145 family)